MIMKNLIRLIFASILFILIGFTDCARDVNLLEEATHPSFAEVFLDDFVDGLDYSAFADSKYDAFDIDNDESYKGYRSIRITVPGLNDPSGWFAGGVFYSKFPRDLSGYNALTFWGKASKTTVAIIGLGNDNTGNSLYEVLQRDVLFGTSWQKYVIPIPLAGKLVAETGMFEYAAGADENGLGCTLWFDEVQFESLGTIAYPRIVFSDTLVTGLVGGTIDPGITGVIFNVDGVDQIVEAAPAYFTLTSLNTPVADITDDGKIIGIAEGSAKILVQLGSVAEDTITVNIGTGYGPMTPAPVPAVPADRVISLFSDIYTSHPGVVWNTYWQFSTAQLEETDVTGDNVKLYTNLNFVGIEFTAPLIDASEMTHFHIDIWTPDSTSLPNVFKIKLVDFGANGVWSGGDDKEHELAFDANSGLITGSWIGFDIPLFDFTGLTSRAHLAQLVLSGDLPTVYADNVYFYSDDSVTL